METNVTNIIWHYKDVSEFEFKANIGCSIMYQNFTLCLLLSIKFKYILTYINTFHNFSGLFRESSPLVAGQIWTWKSVAPDRNCQFDESTCP